MSGTLEERLDKAKKDKKLLENELDESTLDKFYFHAKLKEDPDVIHLTDDEKPKFEAFYKAKAYVDALKRESDADIGKYGGKRRTQRRKSRRRSKRRR